MPTLNRVTNHYQRYRSPLLGIYLINKLNLPFVSSSPLNVGGDDDDAPIDAVDCSCDSLDLRIDLRTSLRRTREALEPEEDFLAGRKVG